MKRAVSIILAVVILSSVLSVPVIAERASDQIASYSVGIVPRGNGKVEVTVNIGGTHRQMTRIGFPSILLYERNNSSSPWVTKYVTGPHYNPTVPAGSHTYTFTYQGVAGRQYYAHATFFARDNLGSDSRQASSPFITAT